MGEVNNKMNYLVKVKLNKTFFFKYLVEIQKALIINVQLKLCVKTPDLSLSKSLFFLSSVLCIFFCS